jgi:LPXTG-site transpeptidase (sortase) family protein
VGAVLIAGAAVTIGLPGTRGASEATATPSPAAVATARPTPSSTLPAVNPTTTPSPTPESIVARRIRVPRLGIDLRVVEGDGIDAPMRKAAHYPGTAWPGGGSNIFIYAHAQAGMFLALWDARPGDEILLDLADGTTRGYVVTEVLPRVAWNALEYLDPTPTERLTLQTSTSYTPTAPRFIVLAEPAP